MRRIVLAALIVVSSGISAHAQSTQVWPEISAFTRLNAALHCIPIVPITSTTAPTKSPQF